MENIQLEGIIIELHYGRNEEIVPALLERWEKGEGVIPSEADIRLYGINNKNIRDKHFNTSTLSATRGKDIKVILPYETGSRKLTDAARFGLGLINPNEDLVNYGVNLDKEDRWEQLDGRGVYTLQRKGLILNQDLTEVEAMKHKLLLTKLGHPDYVDSKFARSKDEVAEIIGKTFEFGKSEYGYDTMMGQYLPEVSKKGVLKAWFVVGLGGRARSDAGSGLVYDDGKFAFDSVGGAKIAGDKARVQFQSLERMLKSGQIDELGNALDERDQLRKRLLTADQIYSVIGDYICSANESEVRKVLDKLTKQ